jgi:serine/threonine protein kinase/tetratricopeptide (TPR) repeat protein
MSQSRDDRLAALFARALELPPSRRGAFLAHACPDDDDLRSEVTSLLEANEDADEYFDRLAEDAVAPMLGAMASAEALKRLRAPLRDAYRIERELGGGGMSRVYEAEDLRLKRRVVIKVPPTIEVPPLDTEDFRREIELAAQLQHPHIVPLLEADIADGTRYYTMPLVNGESLRDRLSREGHLQVDSALHIWRDVLDALGYAHMRGVIHRDIKPANILLSGRNALVTDFGIARAMATVSEAADPLPAPIFGTPAYMAPEQVTGGDGADPRVDIYQAGLVMYEMLSGRLPFEEPSGQDLLQARVTRDPQALSVPGAPRALTELVMRCVAREPGRRPASVNELIAELDRLVPIAAAPQRGRSRRTPLVAAVAVAPVAALVIAFAARPSASPVALRSVPDIAAHEWYERGMDPALLRNAAGHEQALDYFERSIEIDSAYAAAWAGIARMSVQMWNAAPYEQRPGWIDRAEHAALRAVALDESDPDAQAALGWVRLAQTDNVTAERAFKRALALDPRVSRGHEGLARVYMMTGRPRQELAEAQLGMEADPFSHSAFRELALALAMNDRCEEALEGLAGLKRLSPPASVAGVIAGMCYASRHRWDEAIAEFRWSSDEGATFAPAFLAYSLAGAGRREEAEAILSEFLAEARVSHGAFGIATVYAGLGDYDRAFAWLDRAVDEASVNSYVMHPVFATLHRDARFRNIERRMGVSLVAP